MSSEQLMWLNEGVVLPGEEDEPWSLTWYAPGSVDVRVYPFLTPYCTAQKPDEAD